MNVNTLRPYMSEETDIIYNYSRWVRDLKKSIVKVFDPMHDKVISNLNDSEKSKKSNA